MYNSATLTLLFFWSMTTSVCIVGKSAFVTLRVRLPTGSISRINVTDDTSIGELCERVHSDSDCIATAIRIGEHTTNFSIARRNATKLVDAGVRNGDLLDLSHVSANQIGGNGLTKRMHKRSIKKKGTGRRGFASLADLEKQRADMVKITRELPDDSIRVVQHAAVQGVLERLSLAAAAAAAAAAAETGGGGGGTEGGMALLVGRFANSSSNGAATAEVSGAFEIGSSGYDAAVGLRDSESFLVNNALLVAEDLGLDVIGVALGIDVATEKKAHTGSVNIKRSAHKRAIKSSAGLLWNARHVHCALQVRAATRAFVTGAGLRTNLVRDPFLMLSAAREPGTETLSIRVEAFRLSVQALQLHRNGNLPAVPTSSAHAAGDAVHLSVKVRGIAGADDSAQVDSSLLCVPVAIASRSTAEAHAQASAGAGAPGIEMEHAFPSMAGLQRDPMVAGAARQYLVKLLGRATEPLRAGDELESAAPGAYALHDVTARLRDPQLLLYLSTVMEQPIFRMLCRHLRCNGLCGGGINSEGPATLPIEVLVALEQARQYLL